MVFKNCTLKHKNKILSLISQLKNNMMYNIQKKADFLKPAF